mgnify:CR=1 FL=1
MNWATEVIVGMMVMSMVIVLILAWKWFGSLRTAFLSMLVIGKVWAGVLWAFGIDRPLFTIYIYNKVRGTTSSFTLTADQMVFLSFLTTFAFVIAWPYIAPHIPEPIRKIQVLEGERS